MFKLGRRGAKSTNSRTNSTRSASMARGKQTPSANAQANRTWVSGAGDDANPCSRTLASKRSFATTVAARLKALLTVDPPELLVVHQHSLAMQHDITAANTQNGVGQRHAHAAGRAQPHRCSICADHLARPALAHLIASWQRCATACRFTTGVTIFLR